MFVVVIVILFGCLFVFFVYLFVFPPIIFDELNIKSKVALMILKSKRWKDR